MSPLTFDLLATDGVARAGMLHTPHGDVPTPLFAPVGTQATVKAVTPDQLEALGAGLILANTYHLYLRPGHKTIAALGGLHRFMGWPHPILTDSGGFQVFSLAERRVVDADGVTFRSHIDGSTHRFTPETAVAVQEHLGADIIMTLDDCPPPTDRQANEDALRRTHAWAERCLAAHRREDQAQFGIVQGGVFEDLREQSAAFIAGLGFPGIAIGGLSVGEPKESTYAVLDHLADLLPTERPRYLMGVGTLEDFVEAVLRGVDMMDCVLPTRMARNHTALTRLGRVNIRNAGYADDSRPIDAACGCYTCRGFSRAYLRHLANAGEMLAATLLTIHNLFALMALAADIRNAIVDRRVRAFADDFRASFRKHRPAEV